MVNAGPRYGWRRCVRKGVMSQPRFMETRSDSRCHVPEHPRPRSQRGPADHNEIPNRRHMALMSSAVARGGLRCEGIAARKACRNALTPQPPLARTGPGPGSGRTGTRFHAPRSQRGLEGHSINPNRRHTWPLCCRGVFGQASGPEARPAQEWVGERDLFYCRECEIVRPPSAIVSHARTAHGLAKISLRGVPHFWTGILKIQTVHHFRALPCSHAQPLQALLGPLKSMPNQRSRRYSTSGPSRAAHTSFSLALGHRGLKTRPAFIGESLSVHRGGFGTPVAPPLLP